MLQRLQLLGVRAAHAAHDVCQELAFVNHVMIGCMAVERCSGSGRLASEQHTLHATAAKRIND